MNHDRKESRQINIVNWSDFSGLYPKIMGKNHDNVKVTTAFFVDNHIGFWYS